MIQLSVPNITCAQCASVIANAVKGRDPSAKCDVDIDTKRVSFESKLPPWTSSRPWRKSATPRSSRRSDSRRNASPPPDLLRFGA